MTADKVSLTLIRGKIRPIFLIPPRLCFLETQLMTSFTPHKSKSILLPLASLEEKAYMTCFGWITVLHFYRGCNEAGAAHTQLADTYRYICRCCVFRLAAILIFRMCVNCTGRLTKLVSHPSALSVTESVCAICICLHLSDVEFCQDLSPSVPTLCQSELNTVEKQNML